MPLKSGNSKATISANIREMSKTHPHAQAVAAALRTAYGPKRAAGGHVGPLPGATGGRADRVHTQVEDGSHIISADAVAALGDGNTEAGYAKLMKLFPHSVPGRSDGGILSTPHMTGLPHLAGVPGGTHGLGKLPHLTKMASGGSPKMVDVRLSHGEFRVSPRDVKDVAGRGDRERGHRAIDALQMHIRRRWIKKLKSLPGPATD